MADVRSMLRNERTARRISHPHATYSTTGTLVCLVCHIQLKSESLWNGHLRSAQHAMRLQRIRDGTLGRPPGAPAPELQEEEEEEEDGNGQDDPESLEPARPLADELSGSSKVKSKKRKADDDDDDDDYQVRKRSRADGLPEGFFDGGSPLEADPALAATTGHTPPLTGQEIQLPSRPATPLKVPETIPIPISKATNVDEDEWAAFEADIAAAEAPPPEDAIIIAPALSTAELANKSREEENAHRKERAEAELEGDKEDAARKLEEEFEQMEALEGRIRKLKEKREALRVKGGVGGGAPDPVVEVEAVALASNAQESMGDEDEDEDEDDDDGWDGFRMKT